MDKIKLEIKDGDKVIKSQDIELKELNVWDDLKFNDLLLEHSRNLDKDLCIRAGKVVQLCTGMSDKELTEIGAEGILQLFPLIIQAKAKKK
tara:strand:+ start:54 stop:326 length:273 start_codon:yes stop_codon:yes gene_type:complete